MADGEGLALGAEQDLLVGQQAAQPDGVHRDAVHVGTTGAVQGGDRGVRGGGAAGLAAGLGDELGGAGGGAAGGVHLVRVVQFDDLDGLEVRGGDLRELHGQHGADGEVRCDEHTRLRRLVEQARQMCEAVVGPAGGADDRVDAVAYAEVEVAHDRCGGGQFDGDLGAGLGKGLQSVAPAERGHQFHVVGGLDRPYRLGPDAALGSEDRHTQLAHLPCFLTGEVETVGWGRTGPRRRCRAAWPPACP
ncbi:hypothetical protein SHIRM173S_04692 [Streptomyces hirsutus]